MRSFIFPPLSAAGLTGLREGQRVEYELVPGTRWPGVGRKSWSPWTRAINRI